MWKRGISEEGFERIAKKAQELENNDTWVVVSYYAGGGVFLGIEGHDKPKAEVRLVGSEMKCKEEADFIQEELGGGAANVIVEAYPIEEAQNLFDIHA